MRRRLSPDFCGTGYIVRVNPSESPSLSRIRPEFTPLDALAVATYSRPMSTPDRTYPIVINAAPDRIWKALTHDTQAWYFGNTVHSSWLRGDTVTYVGPDGEPHIHGTVLAVTPLESVVTTFRPVWNETVSAAPETETEWTLVPIGPLTAVTLTHRGMPQDIPAAAELDGGWTFLLSNLKTLLETGAPMPRV